MSDQQDRKFTTANVVSAFLLGGVIIAGLVKVISLVLLKSGDTPVILVGDSMKFKAGVSNELWAEVTPHVSYKITAPQPTLIVVKDNTGSDLDVLRVGVPSSGWEVDEFAVIGNSTTAVASITPTASPSGLAANLINEQVGALGPTPG